MRYEWVEIQEQLMGMEEICIDIERLINLANRFYNLTIERTNKNKVVLNLFEARMIFESCLTIIKSMIEPGDNELIEHENNDSYFNFDKMKDSFDNMLAILDLEQKEIKDFINESKKISDPLIFEVSLKSFREKLIDYMENLILFPFMSTIQTWREKRLFSKTFYSKEDKEKNNPMSQVKVFEYSLYRQVLISAKIKGSPIRQKSRVASNSLGATFHDTTTIRPGKQKTSAMQEGSNDIPNEIDDFPEMYYSEDII